MNIRLSILIKKLKKEQRHYRGRDKRMKVLLVAVNAKYIHSNLAVYCLKSYAMSKGYEVEIEEYTINQPIGDILRDLYKKKADIVGFSCYIWNIEYIKALLKDYKKICPKSELWLGGPEVSYRAKELLLEFPRVRGVMVGEGEETFFRLLSFYDKNISFCSCAQQDMLEDVEFSKLSEVAGIVFRKENGEIVETPVSHPLDFSRLPFPYGDGSVSIEGNIDVTPFENRIVYYESSRGCPFSCAYCLSSIEKQVRFRDIELVKKEWNFFLDRKVPQIKLIDRTFNVNPKRTLELLYFIKEHDNGVTNFHFEIAAELLTKEQMEVLASLRAGLVQLEIGVQSTNETTLEAVHRKTELSVLKEKIALLRENDNVHIHLDLIAGLPEEDMESFIHSFNEVYQMHPHQLQLGFLKVLSGSPMEQMAKKNKIVYQSNAPYEVLLTKWLSFDEIIRLKNVEEMVEIYYNSGQFLYSIQYLLHSFEAPFSFYEALANFYEAQGLFGEKLARKRRYELLLEFAKGFLGETEILEQLLLYDYCLREKIKGCPTFAKRNQMDKQELRESYTTFGIKKEEEGMHDIEKFSFDPVMTAFWGKQTGAPCKVLFSYEEREPMYGQASTTVQSESWGAF